MNSSKEVLKELLKDFAEENAKLKQYNEYLQQEIAELNRRIRIKEEVIQRYEDPQ